MANQDQTTVQLLLKAKDEASKVVDKFSKTVSDLSEKTQSTSDKLVENDNTLKNLTDTYSKLRHTIDSVAKSSKLINQLKSTKRAVDSANESFAEASAELKAQGQVVSAAKEKHRELKEEWLSAKAALDKLGRANKENTDAVNAQRDVVRRANEAQKESSANLNREVSALNKLTTAQTKASAARSKSAHSYDQVADKARKAGISVDDVEKETKQYTSALNEASSALTKTRSAIDTHTKSLRKQGRETDKTRGKTKKYNSEVKSTGLSLLHLGSKSRQSMNVTQRLRGEILSITAAYIGLYGAIDRTTQAFKSYALQQGNIAKLTAVYEGDTVAVAEDLAFVADEAERLGLRLGTLEKSYSDFFIAAKKSGETTETIRAMFTSIMEGAATFKLSQDDVDGAMRAMIQIMSKGKVMAEELQGQLAERFPGAVSIFAESLDISSAKLRKMMEDSELTSDQLLGFTLAMQKTTEAGLPQALSSLSAEFNRLSNTGEELERSFGMLVEDEARDAIVRLNNVLKGEAGVKLVQKLAIAFEGVVNATVWVVENLDTIVDALKLLAALKLAQMFSSWIIPLMKVATAMGAVATRTALAKGNLAKLALEATSLMLGFGAISLIEDKFEEMGQTVDDVTAKINKLETSWSKADQRRKVNIRKQIDDLKALRDEMVYQKEADESLTFTGGSGGGAQISEAAQSEAKLRKDFLEEWVRITELTDASDKAWDDAQKERNKQIKKLLSETKSLYSQYMSQAADTIEKQFVNVDSKYDPLIAKARELGQVQAENQLRQAKSHAQDMVLKEELINIEKQEEEDKRRQLDRIKEVESEINFALDVRKAKFDEINALRERGDVVSMKRADALENQTKANDRAIISLIDNAIQLQEELGDDKAIFKLEQMKKMFEEIETPLINVRDRMWELSGGITEALTEFGAGIADVIRGAGDMGQAFDRAGQAFAKFASQFLIKIGEMILQQLIFNAIKGFMGGGYSGGQPAIANTPPSTGGGFSGWTMKHNGGMVGSSTMTKSGVDSSVFASAARYHTGGVVGLKPNEIPIIAERGEEVLTSSDPRHRSNGGMGGNTTVQVIDQRSADSAPAETVTETDSNGNDVVKVFIRDIVDDSLNDGSLDSTMARFGAKRQTVRR